MDALEVRRGVSLAPYTTLKAGGPAELFVAVDTVDDLAAVAESAHTSRHRLMVLGWGSNILPSDAGVAGTVVLNRTRRIAIEPDGTVEADTGCGFQDLFLKAAQARLGGLEFAVGIPGTLGGALASNAGAYRSNVSALLTELEVVAEGRRRWVEPSFLRFSYRDSILRTAEAPPVAVLRVRMKLQPGDPKQIYDAARDFQRQRISKQPPPASAGSFFKNVVDADLAQRVQGLTDGMRAAGVVPAGFLLEAVGLKGFRLGGAMFGARHANFILNVGRASATEIRRLAEHGAQTVADRFGVRLEEEVLYVGDWSGYRSS